MKRISNKKSNIISILTAVIVLLFLFYPNKSFDDKAADAFDALEYNFVNRIAVQDMDEDTIRWIHDTAYDMEENPDSYNDREKYIINNLSSMMVRVGMMNSLDYRDRILEDQYYDARDSVQQALSEGE